MGSGTLLKPAAIEPCSSLHVQMQIKTIRQKNNHINEIQKHCCCLLVKPRRQQHGHYAWKKDRKILWPDLKFFLEILETASSGLKRSGIVWHPWLYWAALAQVIWTHRCHYCWSIHTGFKIIIINSLVPLLYCILIFFTFYATDNLGKMSLNVFSTIYFCKA